MTPIQIGHEGDGEGVTSVFCCGKHLRLDEIVAKGWITEERAKALVEDAQAIEAGVCAEVETERAEAIVRDFNALPAERVEAARAKLEAEVEAEPVLTKG